MTTITLPRATVEQALEALLKSHTCPLLPDDCEEAIDALRAALAEPVQEPVAWMATYKSDDGTTDCVFVHSEREIAEFADGVTAQPLYTAPQPAQNSFSTAQGAQADGQPAQTDQGLPRTLAAGDRRDERNQDYGRTDRCAGGEAAGAGRAGSAVDQHRCDGLAEGADGADAGCGAADFLLTEPELRAMYSAARRSPESEHTVWWILVCRAVEREVMRRVAQPEQEPVAWQCAECGGMERLCPHGRRKTLKEQIK